MKKIVKIVLKSLVYIALFGFLFIVLSNGHVILTTKNQVVSENSKEVFKDADCILVLGAGVWDDKPSPMLKDRLKTGIDLYKKGAAPKILMSGDHGKATYDEVNVMKKYAVDKGLPSKDIFMDHAGFSTYDSIYRAKKIFKAKKIIIVTQEYHLFRALHIANALGLDAYGVSASKTQYMGKEMREAREVLARSKDFVKAIFKPKSTYEGAEIPVSGDGDLTNDKDSFKN